MSPASKHDCTPPGGRLAPSINIYSGEKGLGGALTNPSELARRKGNITQAYPVTYQGKRWSDVETAYQALKKDTPAQNDQLMVELIAAKFRQHERLAEAVCLRGGADWLASCSHQTGARSESFQAWEGDGLASRFIRNLVAGYKESLVPLKAEDGQNLLF